MKIIIVAGGGGHFSPALSVLENIPTDWKVLIIGRKYTFEKDQTESFEFHTAKSLGIPFEPIITGRLQRKLTLQSLKSLGKTPIGVYQAYQILTKFQPDVILSFGGYVSIPVVLAAAVLHIPLVLHEQTLHAGLANKFASRFARRICVSFESSKKYFPEYKTIITGNPLRKLFISNNKVLTKIKKPLPVIYVTGGSSGSHGINLLIEGCLEQLLDKYILIHQTGDAKEFKDYDRLLRKKDSMPGELKKRYIVMKYVDVSKVPHFLNEADLVVSRAGMNTVMELLYLGKPCLLIPLIYGQKNEQLDNSLFVKKIGLAEVASQNELSPQKLVTLIDQMFQSFQVYKSKSLNGRKYINLDAAQRIIEVIEDVKKEASN